MQVADIEDIILASEFLDRTPEQRAFMITQKEHPLDNMIVFAVHEC